ncbi:DNA ligase D [Weizmannia acidilactici]|uniref:DNA ligase D n=1 Tax=Weizmannia acidilactici TaxID=2607726 RepID=UPI00124DE6A9|nr:DNA ligase D [Weizmannia acidilactici]GER74540.1 bifunctional non-homologous end joining protein LigD [Weizmannia acidilactici]
MKPMLPTLKWELPNIGNWAFEIKYDGFRAILEWDDGGMHLWSRNEKDLLPQFPEIRDFLQSIENIVKKRLPLRLDGELALLENPFKANFGELQSRGRMKSTAKIKQAAAIRPARFLAFDLLMLDGADFTGKTYMHRKETLENFFQNLELPLSPDPGKTELLQLIPYAPEAQQLIQTMKDFNSEGIVAKQTNSKWEAGKRVETWIKIKNWKTAACFITAYDGNNGYYHVAVFRNSEIFPLGLFLFSMSSEEKQVLTAAIKKNAANEKNGVYTIHPAICLELFYLEWDGVQLREPHFHRFRFDLAPDECTYERFRLQQAAIPEEVAVTHPEKPLWEKRPVSKLDYLFYMREISPFMLPFLSGRLLTVIRYPHGVFGEAFYQKNCPDYAPAFVETAMHDGIRYIVCNDLKTLMWLANQLAVEYHIPYQVVKSRFVSEIVFDLDPPSRSKFHLAVKAALLLKDVLDGLGFESFVKISGNKGLQIYIPLQEGRFTWKDTRIFTEFMASYLIAKAPESFTVERMKKKRGGKLYVDFIQHAEGKTIIAPYSMRGHEDALVSAPLRWEEVSEKLFPELFTMEAVLNRVKKFGCPFARYFTCKKEQPFAPVLDFLKKNDSGLGSERC